MAFRTCAAALALACAMSSGAVQAERLAIEGVYAARTDGVRGVSAIAIEPIAGREGAALENALAHELGDARIHGEPYFRYVSMTLEGDAHDTGAAYLHGYADARVDDVEDGVLEHSRCLRKEFVGEGKHRKKECVESVTDVFECRRLHVDFHPGIAVMSGGITLYRRQDRVQRSERYCADSSYVPSVEAMLDPMISRFVRLVRLDLAPEQRINRFRILESRKGLERAERKLFKQAIKLTKTDPVGACIAFEDILTRNPFHRSTLYNAALCREAAGELSLAGDAYEQLILASDKSRFRNGKARVDSRILAREQMASLEFPILANAETNRRNLAGE